MVNFPVSRGLIPLLFAGLVALAGCVTPPPMGNAQYQTSYPNPVVDEPLASASIFGAAGNLILFEDAKARRVGDILLVLLVEETSGKKSSGTQIDKANNATIADPTLAGKKGALGRGRTLDFELSDKQKFSGDTGAAQSNSLNGSIAVTVAEVLPGGNLIVQGEKWIQINQGKEYIRLKGMVRPRDVTPDNTIYSTQIADARISYSAKGAAGDANSVGWLSRFFLGPMWPF